MEQLQANSLQADFKRWQEKETERVSQELAEVNTELGKFLSRGFNLAFHIGRKDETPIVDLLEDPANVRLKEFTELLLQRERWRLRAEMLEGSRLNGFMMLELFWEFMEEKPHALDDVILTIFRRNEVWFAEALEEEAA